MKMRSRKQRHVRKYIKPYLVALLVMSMALTGVYMPVRATTTGQEVSMADGGDLKEAADADKDEDTAEAASDTDKAGDTAEAAADADKTADSAGADADADKASDSAEASDANAAGSADSAEGREEQTGSGSEASDNHAASGEGAAEESKDADQKSDAEDPTESENETKKSAEETAEAHETASGNESASDVQNPETASGTKTGEETSAAQQETTKGTAQAAPNGETLSTQTEVLMPAQTFSEDTEETDTQDSVTVTVDAPEGAFPEDTTMTVSNVDDEDILKKALQASGIAGGQDDTTDENATRLVKEKAVNITFYDASGKKIEPKKAIHVTITSDDFAASVDKPEVVHVKDNGKAVLVKTKDAEDTQADASDANADDVDESADSTADVVAETRDQAEVKSEAEAKSETEAESKAQAEVKTEAEVETKAKAAVITGIITRLKALVKPKTAIKTGTETELDGTSKAGTETETEPEERTSEVSFDAKRFSVYAVIYTVDFYYGSNTYLLHGGQGTTLTELLGNLNIPKDDQGTVLTREDVEDVTFSDPELVSVEKQENDWVLTAQKAFSTEEKLTLTLTNGDQITVKVTDDNALDLSEYITEVTVQKEENGQWKTATQFNDGDSVNVNIKYTIGAGQITSDNKTATYKLPVEITPMEDLDGVITNDGRPVGRYTIDTNGMITLIFNDDFAKEGSSISGTVTFQGRVSNKSGSESGTINFPGKSNTITVVTPDQTGHDIRTEKTGEIDPSHTKVSYTVTASTTKGTGKPVTIEDQFGKYQSTNVKSFTYDQNSLHIYKVDADEERKDETDSYKSKVTFTTTDGQPNGVPKFEIKDLPALGPGEKYEVTYDVDFASADADKATEIKNQAHAQSGDYNGWTWNTEKVEVLIEKEGGYDPYSNTFWWRIKLNNGNGEDVSGWTIKDAVEDEHKIVGDVRIFRIENGQPESVANIGDFNGQSEFSINLSKYLEGLPDEQKKRDFWIEYRTEAPDGNPGANVSETNHAHLTGQGTESDTRATVTGTLRDWNVSKVPSHKDTTGLNDDGSGMLYEYWHSEVTIGAGNLTSFTYTDDIGEVLDNQGKDQHYATAEELEKYFTKPESPNANNRSTGLYLKLDEYDRYNYNGDGEATTQSDYNGADKKQADVTIKVTYYDADEKEVLPTDPTTPVKKFKVTVTPAPGKTINAQSLVLKEYRTMVNTNTQKAGEKWTIQNSGEVRGKTSKATDEYTRPHKFVKEVYTGKTNNGEPLYKEGDQKVPYKWDSFYLADKIQLDEGQLLYRLMLHTSQNENGTNITITDTLPAGMTVVENSVDAKFYQNVWTQHDSNYEGTDFKLGNKPSYTTTTNDDGTTTLTITIPSYKYSSNYRDVAVYYKVSVAEDPAWNDPAMLTKAYENSASWNDQTSSDNVKVEREKTVIGKSGVQLDKDGNPVQIGSDGKPIKTPTGKIRYTIVINSAADDLDPKANTLTLVDTMGNSFNPQLDLSSVQLFNYDSTKEKNIGTELISTSYEMVYDATNHKMTLTVPDSKAMILVYDYSIDENYPGTPTITNKADLLNGKWTSEDSAKLVEIKSSATAQHNQIIIYKVDSRNYKKTLPDAEFKLESYDYNSSTGTGTWVKVSDQLITNEDGEITFDLLGEHKQLKENTLYKLTETEAPEGYGIDQTPHYFIWKGESVTDDEAYNRANAGNRADEHGTGGVDKSKITFFSNGGDEMYIPNEYTRIGVVKSWAKPDGSAYTPPKETVVNVALYQSTLDGCKIKAGYQLSWPTTDEIECLIAKGSDIRITVNAGATPTIIYGDQSETMTKGSNNNEYYYTIRDVQTDLTNIKIKCDNNIWAKGLAFDGYTVPSIATGIKSTQQYGSVVTLNKKNNWTYSWDNLPKTDGNGNPYYYTMEETAVTQNGKNISSQYTTTYSTNNNGIQNGQIVITNTAKEDEITLPSTGGMGTWIFRAMGIISLGIGIEILLFVKRKIAIGGKSL